MNHTVFEWHSFWVNIVAGIILLIPSILISIWLIPKFTLKLIKKRNKKYSAIKIGSILQVLTEFLSDSPFKDKELNKEHITIVIKNLGPKDPRHIILLNTNVFNQIVFPKMTSVITEFFEKKDLNEKYDIITTEYHRIKEFRFELERILATHSLYIEDEIIQKVSCFCFDIKTLEARYKWNLEYGSLLAETKSERTGVFGLSEIIQVYESLLPLIRDLIIPELYDYEITSNNEETMSRS
jgi:hypothetical protein